MPFLQLLRADRMSQKRAELHREEWKDEPIAN